MGDGGTIVHFDGYAWEEMITNSDTPLSAVHGRSSLDVTAVGLNGQVLHFNGLVWQERDSGVSSDINGIWCLDNDRKMAVGSGGLLLYNSGLLGEDTPWEILESGTDFSLYDITGDSDGNLYAAGYNGVVLRYDGQDWNFLTTGYHDRLNTIHLTPCGDILTGGLWGLVIRYGY